MEYHIKINRIGAHMGLGIPWNIMGYHKKSTRSATARAWECLGIQWNSAEYHLNINAMGARKGLGILWNTMEQHAISHKGQHDWCPQGLWNSMEYNGIA